MAAAPMNLSLLSRGVGEVKTNGHENIDVKLEPEDYYNWLDDPRREWNVTKVIPPIPSLTPRLTRPSQPSTRAPPPSQAYYSQDFTPRSCFSNDSKQSEVYLPKTFTTRKGALLLFSEDLAQRRAKRIRHRLARSADDSKLNTVEDLAKSILSYGAKQTFSHEAEDITLDDRVYMGFGNDRSRRYFERQYKPGFSAKRYLASWTKHWNYTVFENITKKGYLKTNTRLLKKSEFDVSGIPLPYRILRQWLFAPGTLDGYTFYRQRQPSMIRENTIEEDGRPGTEKEAVVPGDIVITSINDNKEVDYANLDSSTKETILTELLVKSAITHAINKQKEFQEAVAADPALEAAASSQLFQFDMMKAIESALEQPVLPTVNTLSMKADEFLPVNPPVVQKKGFRGARGVAGVKSQSEESMSGSMRSLDSIGSENLDRKYKKVPPIRKPSRQPGNYYFTSEMENEGQEEPIIQKPPIIPTQREEDDRRFDDYDDLTNNLRNTRKSQSLQSIHTVNMEEDVTHSVIDDSRIHVTRNEIVLNIPSPEGQAVLDVPPNERVVSRSLPATPGRNDVRNNAQTAFSSERPTSVKASTPLTSVPLRTVELQPFAEAIQALDKRSKKMSSSERLIGELEMNAVVKSKRRVENPRSAKFEDSQSDHNGDFHSEAELSSIIKVTEMTSPKLAKSLDLLDQVGLDSEDETDKKSVLSVASIMSRRSRVSGNDAKSLSYSQGITARQVGGPTGDFDPSGALTSWKYEGEERPESAQKFISQLTKDVESAAPSLLDESEIPQSALSSRISPYSVPGQEGVTPVILPAHDVSEAEATSQISEGEFLEVITEQAREIAKNILNSNPESGHDLASDAKKAAELLMSNIPSEANTTRDQSEAVSETGEGDDEEAYGGGTTIADAMLAGMEELVPQIDEVYGDPIRGSKNTTRESSAHPSDGSYSIAGTEGKTPSIIDRTPSIGSVHTNTPDASRPSSDKTIRASIPSATSALTLSVDASRITSAQLSEVELPEFQTDTRTLSKPGSSISAASDSTPTSLSNVPPSTQPLEYPVETRPADSAKPPQPAEPAVPADPTSETADRKSAVPKGERAAVPEDTALTEFKSKPPSSKAESVIQAEHTAALVENPTGEITKSPEKSTSAVSKKSSDKGSRKEIGVDHEKEFVVGKVKDKTETALYTPLESPPKLKEKKTGKAAEPKTVKKTPQKVKPSPGKKQSKGTKSKAKPEKKVVIPAPKEPTPIPPPPKTPTPEPVKQPTPTPSPEYEEWKTPSPVEEEDMEFIIVRDDESDEEEADETSVKLGLGSVKSLNFSNKSPTTGTSSKLSTDDEFDYSDEEFESTGISNKDAQAAKRAAAKEKRRREVERRRREREDAVKKEKEDAERKERIRLQMEEDRVRREEEVRLRKEREREERDREEREEEEKLKKEREAQERERKRQEEIAKYMAEKKRKAEEEEARRKVLQAAREAEEAERRRLEQLMLAEMEEEERKDYLKRKEEEERLRKIQEEEARVRREEEARLIYEEIQRQEEERKRGEELLRQRLLFQRSLNVESHGLDHTQDISRAFVFSYYELLKWLGYEIPEWVKYGPTAGHSNHAESEQ